MAAKRIEPTTSAARPESRKPKHREIFETLLSEIASGRFRPGDRMPTEAELSKTFSASRTTIARAMRDLKARGLLLRQRGGGTRIARREHARRVALFCPFAEGVAGLDAQASRIHTHLSDLASRRADDLRLQFVSSEKAGDGLGAMLAAVDELTDKGVNGVIYLPLEEPAPEAVHRNQLVVERLRAAAQAVVLIDRDIVRFPQRSGLPLVTFDQWHGGFQLAKHLIERGCRRLVMIDGSTGNSGMVHRMRGFFEATPDAGLESELRIVRVADSEGLSEEFCRQLLHDFTPDGIVCQSDREAATLMRRLAALGVKVGVDVAVCGFGDDPIAEALPIPLTTVRLPFDALVLMCYERLLKLMANPSVPDTGVTSVDVELVVRASSERAVTR